MFLTAPLGERLSADSMSMPSPRRTTMPQSTHQFLERAGRALAECKELRLQHAALLVERAVLLEHSQALLRWWQRGAAIAQQHLDLPTSERRHDGGRGQ